MKDKRFDLTLFGEGEGNGEGELMMDFEKEFGVEIPQEVAENMQTVGDVLNYLEEHKDEIK